MYSSHAYPFCAVITILFCVFSLFCIVRMMCPTSNDHDVTCEGYPYDTSVHYSRQTNHKGWYVAYYMNYTNSINTDFCVNHQYIKYKTRIYKNEQQALNVSLSMINELVIKIYPTQLREILDSMSFVIGFILFFALMLSCAHVNSTERHRLLS